MQVARSRPLFFSPSPSHSHSVSLGLTFQSCFRQALIVIDDSPLISILVGLFSKVRQSHQAGIELGPSNLNQARILKSLARPVRASQRVRQRVRQPEACIRGVVQFIKSRVPLGAFICSAADWHVRILAISCFFIIAVCSPSLANKL